MQCLAPGEMEGQGLVRGHGGREAWRFRLRHFNQRMSKGHIAGHVGGLCASRIRAGLEALWIGSSPGAAGHRFAPGKLKGYGLAARGRMGLNGRRR